MAYIEGQTVRDKIAERPLKLNEALDIAIQTAQGLQAAHEKGVVHRDIKSTNLMVTPQGQVKSTFNINQGGKSSCPEMRPQKNHWCLSLAPPVRRALQ